MANITITIPDDKVTLVLDSMASFYKYDEIKLENETKAQFAKRMIINKLKSIVREEITAEALIAAKHSADDTVDSITLS